MKHEKGQKKSKYEVQNKKRKKKAIFSILSQKMNHQTKSKQSNVKENTKIHKFIPHGVRYEYKPRNVEQDRTKEKHSIRPPKALAATLDRNKRKERNHQIDQQHTVVQRAQRSNQRTTNLKQTNPNQEQEKQQEINTEHEQTKSIPGCREGQRRRLGGCRNP